MCLCFGLSLYVSLLLLFAARDGYFLGGKVFQHGVAGLRAWACRAVAFVGFRVCMPCGCLAASLWGLWVYAVAAVGCGAAGVCVIPSF